MGDSLNIRTQLSQIESVQKVQQVQHKEAAIAQQQAAGQMIAKTEQDNRQVVSSHKAEKDRITEKKEGNAGGQTEQGSEKKHPSKRSGGEDEGAGDGDGHHIDIEV